MEKRGVCRTQTDVQGVDDVKERMLMMSKRPYERRRRGVHTANGAKGRERIAESGLGDQREHDDEHAKGVGDGDEMRASMWDSMG